MDDLERQRRLRLERDALSFDTPNCSACLLRMRPAQDDGEIVWQCMECGEKKR